MFSFKERFLKEFNYYFKKKICGKCRIYHKYISLPIKKFQHPYHRDAPSQTPLKNKYKSIFNWTMTYRRDADIFLPYFEIFNISNTDITFTNAQNVKSNHQIILQRLFIEIEEEHSNKDYPNHMGGFQLSFFAGNQLFKHWMIQFGSSNLDAR